MIEYRTSYSRRCIGLLIALAPFVLAVLSLLSEADPFLSNVALIIGCFALLVGGLNFWLSFLRPFLWQRQHGSMEDYRFISGLPGIGTILAVAACLLAFGATVPALIALVVFVIDSGGLPWFVFCTWGDRSLWDAEHQINGE